MEKYCKICEKITEFRDLDCEDCKAQGKKCELVICTQCGNESTSVNTNECYQCDGCNNSNEPTICEPSN